MTQSTLCRPTCRCPPIRSVSPTPVAVSLFQMRPRAALSYERSPSVRRCERAPGSQRRSTDDHRVVWALKSPGVAFLGRSRSPPPFAAKPSRRGSARRRGSIRRVHAAPARGARHDIARWGLRPGRVVAVLFVVAALALSPLVPRARTGVSPALPWNALGCVGAWAPALSIASGGSRSRPSLQTHFGWRPAINSELARTRGIRLSN